MKNTLLLAVLLMSFALQAQHPKRFERSKDFGIVFGTSYYLGDINPTKHFGGDRFYGGGLTFRNNFDKRWTLKSGISFHKIGAHDEDSDDPWQVNRNLHFVNELIEGTMQMELNFWDYQIGNKNDRFSPYLFAGIAYYNMKPQAEFQGTLFELQPLGTEGQGTLGGGKPYRLNGFALPFGAGAKFNIWSIIAISVEWGMRKTYTDFLDDVSGSYANPVALEEENGRLSMLLGDRRIVPGGGLQASGTGLHRGDPTVKDWYNFTTVTLSFRVDRKPSLCWK